jgi:hypothetical protein
VAVTSDRAKAGGGRSSSDPIATTRAEQRLAPACTGNSLGENDELCQGAQLGCPQEGEVRYWVFRRVVDLTVPGDDPPFERVLDPPWLCVGPEEAAEFDPGAAVAAVIEREFRRVVVQRGTAEVSPWPQTLVNVPTRFSTPTQESYDIPLTLLGQSVVITARAQSWTWHFGDGATETVTDSGTRARAEHVYERAAEHPARVDITWTGTYTLNGDPTAQPINGTVTTAGEPVGLAVREARTQLVAG